MFSTKHSASSNGTYVCPGNYHDDPRDTTKTLHSCEDPGGILHWSINMIQVCVVSSEQIRFHVHGVHFGMDHSRKDHCIYLISHQSRRSTPSFPAKKYNILCEIEERWTFLPSCQVKFLTKAPAEGFSWISRPVLSIYTYVSYFKRGEKVPS